MDTPCYSTRIPAGGHWSLRLARGSLLRLTDLHGGANAGLLFYNPDNMLERYNAPDTLKCQHSFRLTQGHCLYSDMGRIFASIVADDLGWHDTVCGSSHADQIAARWGGRNYQQQRNQWQQNGTDAFLTELAKYGLGKADMAACLNIFSKVVADEQGAISLVADHSPAGSQLSLRFELDTLVVLHNCPHPLNTAASYPTGEVQLELGWAEALTEQDPCRNHCPENRRGFENNALYQVARQGGAY